MQSKPLPTLSLSTRWRCAVADPPLPGERCVLLPRGMEALASQLDQKTLAIWAGIHHRRVVPHRLASEPFLYLRTSPLPGGRWASSAVRPRPGVLPPTAHPPRWKALQHAEAKNDGYRRRTASGGIPHVEPSQRRATVRALRRSAGDADRQALRLTSLDELPQLGPLGPGHHVRDHREVDSASDADLRTGRRIRRAMISSAVP